MFGYGARYEYEWEDSFYLSQSFKGMLYLIQKTGDGLKYTKSPSLEYDGHIVIDQVEIDQV